MNHDKIRPDPGILARPNHPELYHGLMDGDFDSVVRDGDITNHEINQLGADMEKEKPGPLTTFEVAAATPDPLDQAKAVQKKK